MPNTSSRATYLDRLSQTVVAAVGDQRIGIPRFVRLLDRLDSETTVDDSLNSALELCNQIFGGEPVRQQRSGDSDTHGTLHVTWPSGASALISAGPLGTNTGFGSAPEIMILGSAGSIYFDGTNGGSSTVDQVDQR
jgi:hypothetical protein